MKKSLILIPCCGSKKEGGTVEYDRDISIFHYLPERSRDHLMRLRRTLFEYFSLPRGKDIEYPDENTVQYMEAYKRYTGTYSQIYRRISSFAWKKLEKTPQLDLVIVSALYGIVRFNEPIRNYNRTMKDKVQNQTLKTWWRKHGLCEIVRGYIENNRITELHNVLSNDYNDALRGCFEKVFTTYVYHDFSEYRSGSNAHRGKWVDTFVKNF